MAELHPEEHFSSVTNIDGQLSPKSIRRKLVSSTLLPIEWDYSAKVLLESEFGTGTPYSTDRPGTYYMVYFSCRSIPYEE